MNGGPALPQTAAQWGDLGNVLQRGGRHAEAIEAYRRGLALQPDIAPMRSNLGNSLQALGLFEESVAEHRRAVAMRPEWGALHGNLGAALYRLGEMEEALEAYGRALALQEGKAAPPPLAALHSNIAAALVGLNRHEEAIPVYEKSLALCPEQTEAAWNYGLTLLSLGRFREGWPFHERRLEQGYKKVLERVPAPMWDGEASLRGKRILLQAEQGWGDVFQMVRYLPILQAAGAECSLQAPPTFHDLFRRSLPGVELYPVEEIPASLNFRLPITSLPAVLRTHSDAEIPKPIPYLTPDPEKAAAWRRRIDAVAQGCLRVGLVWKGNPEHPDDRNRSMPLETTAPLFARQDALWVILQKGESIDERAWLQRRATVLLPEPEEITSYDDTAAAMAGLDLIVSVDSSPAHLAGALGKPLWLLLPFCADWRWRIGREDSAWYPTARLFRQERRRDWAGVVRRVGVGIGGSSGVRVRPFGAG